MFLREERERGLGSFDTLFNEVGHVWIGEVGLWCCYDCMRRVTRLGRVAFEC